MRADHGARGCRPGGASSCHTCMKWLRGILAPANWYYSALLCASEGLPVHAPVPLEVL